jgi:hypothetical protein
MPSSNEKRSERRAALRAARADRLTLIAAAVAQPELATPDPHTFRATPSAQVSTVAPEVGKAYKLRNGDVVRVTLKRNAISLDGKTLEPVLVGVFREGGGLCAWWPNGVYRASSGLIPYDYDVVEECPL